MTVQEGLAKYKQTAGVLQAEPNYIRKLYDAASNDPRLYEQWALGRISAFEAWKLETGSSNVVVAVIDSGINYTHEDLAPNMWRNPGEIPDNGIDDDGNGYIDDVYGIDAANHDADPRDDLLHGTACAGVIGAAGNNATGIAGVNWAVSIMALKSHASNNNAYDSAVIECFEYVMAMKLRGVNIRVTSNSYGGNERGQAIKDAIDAASALDILNVFAAGNDGSNNDLVPKYPASFISPGILSVAASDEFDNLTYFSNYGRKSVHLAAPGTGILTTDFTGPANYRRNFLGTSAAAPFVAGAAALLAAHAPGASAAEIKSALISSVDIVRSFNNKILSGGRLNVARALLTLSEPDGPPIVLRSLPAGNRTAGMAKVEITLSKPMNRPSVEGAFKTDPSMDGTFAWSNADRTMAFTPARAWNEAAEYKILLASTAADAQGNFLDGNFNRVQDPDGPDDFQWSFRVGPPADDFDRAMVIAGEKGEASGTNLNATKEPGEPNHARACGGASIWFRWQAPRDMNITFDTDGSIVDTVLAVYTGSKVDSLVEIARNDDNGYESSSSVSFLAKENTVYSIAVDGQIYTDYFRDAPGMGKIRLGWFPTPEPIITDFEPDEGKPGDRIFIVGRYFSGITNLLLNGVSITFSNKTDTRIRFFVPEGMPSGRISVSTPIGTGTSRSPFKIEPSSVASFLAADGDAPLLTIRSNLRGVVTIAWPAAASNYVLHSAAQLSATLSDWAPVEGAPANSSEQLELTHPASSSARFYRLLRK